MNLSREKRVLLQASKEAGKVLLKYYGKNEDVQEKSNKSLVSKADLEANRAILKIIRKNFPSHSILTEETEFEDKKSDYKWVIDPLDGTHNFLHGIPIFGTSIALEYKNEIILGVLHFPFMKLTAVAEKAKGAFLNGKRIKVSGKNEISHSLIIFEYAYTNRKEKVDFIGKFVRTTIDLRNFGSAVYDLLLVACGKADGFVILSTHEWDIAAGFLIVEECGGKITDLKGKRWDVSQDKFVVSNGKIHQKLLNYVR
ncbi:inositol monophosphatase [Candidatus Woesearchaeota archaeon]|nr:inositol monophosphatase [Candidatus Woesearchaeota archaeon]